jgi:hypothetical protein
VTVLGSPLFPPNNVHHRVFAQADSAPNQAIAKSLLMQLEDFLRLLVAGTLANLSAQSDDVVKAYESIEYVSVHGPPEPAASQTNAMFDRAILVTHLKTLGRGMPRTLGVARSKGEIGAPTPTRDEFNEKLTGELGKLEAWIEEQMQYGGI